MCLKVFDLDKIQPEGSSTTSPECIGILRIFTNQFPEAKVSCYVDGCSHLISFPILVAEITLDVAALYSVYRNEIVKPYTADYIISRTRGGTTDTYDSYWLR